MAPAPEQVVRAASKHHAQCCADHSKSDDLTAQHNDTQYVVATSFEKDTPECITRLHSNWNAHTHVQLLPRTSILGKNT
jgi:hypothetical protein